MNLQASSLTVYVAPAAGGDREAFAALVGATRTVVSSIALAIVRDAELSRDVAQDVFLSVWQDLRELRDPESFLPWLRQLTRHRSYHVLRTERRRAQRITAADPDTLVAMAADPQPHAGAQMLADEERRLLAVVLDELPDETREVITLYYREGQSTAQVARLLGLSEAGVRQRLARARVRLRRDLLDRFGGVVRQSAPDAAFTAAVMAALAIGTPSLASASTITATSLAVPSLLAKVLTLGSGVLLGAAGGIAGVVLGSRQLKRRARSIEELRAVKRFEFVSLALVLIFTALFPLTWQLTHHWSSQVATFAGFIAGLAFLHTFWLPRILRMRMELEAIEDPARAARARAAERRAAILGWTLGLTFGSLGLIAGLLLNN